MLLLLWMALALTIGQEDIRTFHSIRSFRCDFTDAGGRTMQGEKVTVTGRDSLEGIVFDAIDYKTRKGRMIGNAGAEDVTAIPGDRGGSLIEITPSGNVVVTTIFATPRPKNGEAFDTYYAAMSRHIALSSGASIASQMYGTCKAMR